MEQLTKNSDQRLRLPDPDGVAPLIGFTPSQDLVDFYKSSPLIELQDFYLIDKRPPSQRHWFIGTFSPLTPFDVSIELRTTGIKDGLPIASNYEGGVYYVTPSGAIHLWDPRNHPQAPLIAESITILAQFKLLSYVLYKDDDEQDRL